MPFGKGSGRTYPAAVGGYRGPDGRRGTDTGADPSAEFVRASAAARATEAGRAADPGMADGVRLRLGGDHHRQRRGVGDVEGHRTVDLVARRRRGTATAAR